MRSALPLLFLATAVLGCGGDKDGTGPFVEVCTNGADDDGDGAIDCADPDCLPVCNEHCSNGVDDDGDGAIDCDDVDCIGQCPEICDDGIDNDGDGDPDCADDDCFGGCPEACSDGADNDGDGLVDCDDDDCASTCDADGDGSISEALGGDDCDDTDPDNFPGNLEVCDLADNDCDALIDDADNDVQASTSFWADGDNDGWGDDGGELVRCEQPVGTVLMPGDCDDTDEDINPDAQEVCNGVDDDCDTEVDADDASVDLSTAPPWYNDLDGDLFGDPADSIVQCSQPAGFVDNPDDCRPGDPASYPGAPEVCEDGIDQDCDGVDLIGCSVDTAATWNIVGSADVDLVAGTYTGAEQYVLTGTSSGALYCEYSWDALDWDNSPSAAGANPIVAPCSDPDGNPCAFNFTVLKDNGVVVAGGDCAFYLGLGLIVPIDGPYGYGWHDSYSAGGYVFGPTMMYYYPPLGVFLGLEFAVYTPFTSSYDPVAEQLDYDWLLTYTAPAP